MINGPSGVRVGDKANSKMPVGFMESILLLILNNFKSLALYFIGEYVLEIGYYKCGLHEICLH